MSRKALSEAVRIPEVIFTAITYFHCRRKGGSGQVAAQGPRTHNLTAEGRGLGGSFEGLSPLGCPGLQGIPSLAWALGSLHVLDLLKGRLQVIPMLAPASGPSKALYC